MTPATAHTNMRKNIGIVYLCLSLGGCAAWLPVARTDTTPFASYDEALAAVLSLEPRKSNRQTLEEMGLVPARHPNTLILTHADVVRRFVSGSLLRREDLDPGVLRCVESRNACSGMEITGAKINRERKGSFWADFFNFKRRTETTGWRFTALILLVDDQVVYRSIGGQPTVNEVEQTRNPLGPLQDIGPPAAREALD